MSVACPSSLPRLPRLPSPPRLPRLPRIPRFSCPPRLLSLLVFLFLHIWAASPGCGAPYSLDALSDASHVPDASTDAHHRCGDHRLDPGETCDGTDLGGLDCVTLGHDEGTLACLPDCTLDTSGCGPRCGNGRQDPGEACDGLDTGGATCQSVGLGAGTILCRADCTLDLTHCPGCSNGVREAGEACDGTDLGGLTCVGAPGCSVDCLLDLTGCTLPSAGDGADGPLEVTGDVVLTTPLAGSYVVLSLGGDTVTVDDPAPALGPGDEVLLVNLRGSPGLCDTTGAFETARVAAVQGGEVTLDLPIAGLYGTNQTNADLTGQRVVLQRIPNFTSVHVSAGGVLRPPTFDGTRGGILAMRVQGTLRVDSGGALSADGAGYRGGAGWTNTGRSHGRPGESLCGWPQVAQDTPNFGGGGGGRYQDTSDDCGQGGGGGGYGATGAWLPFGPECVSHGATSPAENGGLPYGVADLALLLPGSGGGAGGTDDHSDTSGTGGAGGGTIWITAATVELDGLLSARGAPGTVPSDHDDSGNGGGGSGGAIWLAAGLLQGAGGLDARGGPGTAAVSNWNSPGAPGGPGRIRLDLRSAGGYLYGSPGAAYWTATHSLPQAGHQQLLLE